VGLLLSSPIFNEVGQEQEEEDDAVLLLENSHHMRLLLSLKRRRVQAACIEPSLSEIYLGIKTIYLYLCVLIR
jgi:hypothetical protein